MESAVRIRFWSPRGSALQVARRANRACEVPTWQTLINLFWMWEKGSKVFKSFAVFWEKYFSFFTATISPGFRFRRYFLWFCNFYSRGGTSPGSHSHLSREMFSLCNLTRSFFVVIVSLMRISGSQTGLCTHCALLATPPSIRREEMPKSFPLALIFNVKQYSRLNQR